MELEKQPQCELNDVTLTLFGSVFISLHELQLIYSVHNADCTPATSFKWSLLSKSGLLCEGVCHRDSAVVLIVGAI